MTPRIDLVLRPSGLRPSSGKAGLLRLTLPLSLAALLAACPPSHPGPAACSGTQTKCNGSCVDVNTDPQNCGACGKACPAGESCASGSCACPAPSVACGSVCVTTQVDALNCGSCGNACLAGELCQGGACVCQSGRTSCSGRCVDIGSDVDNCGGCGKPCPSGQVCSNGQCAAFCAGADGGVALTDCGQSCVNTQDDSLNCGGCNQACQTGQVCAGGSCACGSGQTLCDGGCTATDQNQQNCGACGNVCAAFQSCQAGTCAGPDLWVSCSDYNFTTATANSLVGINSTTGQVQAPAQAIVAAPPDGGTPVAAQMGWSVFTDAKTLWVLDQKNDQVDVLDVSKWPPQVAGSVATDPGGAPNQILLCDGKVIVVNSLTETIQGIDPTTRATVQEAALGANENPWLAACDGAHTLYVSDLVGGDVKSIDLSQAQWGDGGVTTLAIPASSSAASDGGFVGAQPGGIAYVPFDGGAEVLVTLENLDLSTYAPAGPSPVLVLDPALAGVVTSVSPGASCENAQYFAQSPSGAAVLEVCTGSYSGGGGAALAPLAVPQNQFGTIASSPIPNPGPSTYLSNGLVALGGASGTVALWNPADGGVVTIVACPGLADGGPVPTELVAGVTQAP